MKTGMNLYGVTAEVGNGKTVLTYALHPECLVRLRFLLPPSVPSPRVIGPTETDGDKACALKECGKPLREESGAKGRVQA